MPASETGGGLSAPAAPAHRLDPRAAGRGGRRRKGAAISQPIVDPNAPDAATSTPAPALVVDRLLVATHQLQTQTIHAELQRARQAHGLVVTLEQVVLPALQQLGRQWADGTSDVVHEHLLAGAIQGWLATQHRQAPPPTDRSGPIVLACGPEDQHTLGVETFALLLVDRGFDCRYLGAQTPVASLLLAAQRPPARAVVVVSHLEQNRDAAVAALRALEDLAVPSFYAGATFAGPEQRRDVPGVYLGGTLSAGAQQLSDALGPAR